MSQENAGESRNGHFNDAAGRARNDIGEDPQADFQGWMNEMHAAKPSDLDHHNPWLSFRGGPELDPDDEDAYRAEKADYTD